VSNTNLNQPTRAPIPEPAPVTEPASEYRARSSLAAAQEPFSRASTHIPVAVLESESPPHAQYRSETVARNSPMKSDRKFPAR